MILLLIRDLGTAHNLGVLYADGTLIGETLEDPDRHLESGGEKIHGGTAIPRGKYRVTITFSQRFKRPMPLLHDVPGFDGVRIHGGNTEADTSGCILLGAERTETGIRNCGPTNTRLMALLESAEDRGEEVWMEVT